MDAKCSSASSSRGLPTRLDKTISCKQGAVRAVRFNVDGGYCVTCGSDKSIKLWNPHKGLLLKTYSGHGYEVLDAYASCDNSQIVSGSMDKTVFVYDVETGKILRRYRGHAGRINAVGFNEESTVAFSASNDGTVKGWDCRKRAQEPIITMDEATDSVMTFHITDTEIITGSADKRVRRYDLRQGQMHVDFVGASVTSVSVTRDGQCILVSTLDNTVRLLDKESGELLADFTGHKNSEYKIDSCLLSTDAQIFSGSEDGRAYCWDLVEGKLLCALNHPKGSHVVHSLSAHPKKQALLTASGQNVYLWKVDDDEEEEVDIRRKVT